MKRPHIPTPSVRTLWLMLLFGGLALAAFLAWLLWQISDLADAEEDAKRDRGEVVRLLEEANDRLEEAGEEPVPVPPEVTAEPEQQDPEINDPDPDDPEIQDPEIQEPEIRDPEVQQRERQQAEIQDGDPDDPEQQDAEEQNAEEQDAEIDDADPDDPEHQDDEVQNPEEQDAEIQDPEIDDPDPNSLLDFQIRDECEPAAGEAVTDVDLVWERGDGVIVLVLTCTTANLPGPGNP